MSRTVTISFAALSLTAGLLFLFYEPFLHGIVSLGGFLLHRELDFLFWNIGFKKTGVELLVLSVNIFLAILFYKKNPERFILFFCLIWVLVFVIYIIINIVNIPIREDYIYFLQFLNDFSSSYNFHTIIHQEQYVEEESRLILMHLMTVALFYLKTFNFKILLFFSTACLFGIALLFYRSIQIKQKALLFLIIVLLFFQFQDYDSIVFVSAALYNTCTIFFVFCSLYLLNRSSLWTFILSLFFIFLSILNNGCGFIGVMCGIILLISQKRRKHLLIWMIFSILISIFYFTDYTIINDSDNPNFSSFIYTMYRSFVFSSIFLGNSFQFLYQDTIPIIIGGIIWASWIILTFRRYYKKNPVIYFMLLFLIITSFLPSPLFRSEYGHLYNRPLTIRYGIYSMIAICCLIIAFFETTNFLNKQLVMIYFLIFSFFYHLSSNILFYPEMVLRRERLVAFIQHFRKEIASQKDTMKREKAKLLPYTSWVNNEEAILRESISKDIYKIPDE